MPATLEGTSITLTLDAPTAAGDLVVTGFATKSTALQVGARFADALRDEFPGAEVRVALNDEPPVMGSLR